MASVTTEGWIFMVGFRIFDVGLLIVWLVWFFRLRDDDDQSDDDGPGGGGHDPRPRRGPGGGGLGRRIGQIDQGRWRARDHGRSQPRVPRRGRDPVPSPSRVRRPRTPLPAHRRAA
jgi:hypothetical protein